MTSNNKGQPIPIPTSSATGSGTLSAPSRRWWWFDRGQRTMNDGVVNNNSSATSPIDVGSPISSAISNSFSPDNSSSCGPKGASLPAPTSDWGSSRWRRDSLKFDQDDVMLSMRLPPM